MITTKPDNNNMCRVSLYWVQGHPFVWVNSVGFVGYYSSYCYRIVAKNIGNVTMKYYFVFHQSCLFPLSISAIFHQNQILISRLISRINFKSSNRKNHIFTLKARFKWGCDYRFRNNCQKSSVMKNYRLQIPLKQAIRKFVFKKSMVVWSSVFPWPFWRKHISNLLAGDMSVAKTPINSSVTCSIMWKWEES